MNTGIAVIAAGIGAYLLFGRKASAKSKKTTKPEEKPDDQKGDEEKEPAPEPEPEEKSEPKTPFIGGGLKNWQHGKMFPDERSFGQALHLLGYNGGDCIKTIQDGVDYSYEWTNSDACLGAVSGFQSDWNVVRSYLILTGESVAIPSLKVSGFIDQPTISALNFVLDQISADADKPCLPWGDDAAQELLISGPCSELWQMYLNQSISYVGSPEQWNGFVIPGKIESELQIAIALALLGYYEDWLEYGKFVDEGKDLGWEWVVNDKSRDVVSDFQRDYTSVTGKKLVDHGLIDFETAEAIADAIDFAKNEGANCSVTNIDHPDQLENEEVKMCMLLWEDAISQAKGKMQKKEFQIMKKS